MERACRCLGGERRWLRGNLLTKCVLFISDLQAFWEWYIKWYFINSLKYMSGKMDRQNPANYKIRKQCRYHHNLGRHGDIWKQWRWWYTVRVCHHYVGDPLSATTVWPHHGYVQREWPPLSELPADTRLIDAYWLCWGWWWWRWWLKSLRVMIVMMMVVFCHRILFVMQVMEPPV